MITDLLTYVDDLTMPEHRLILAGDETRRVEVPARLRRLEAAVTDARDSGSGTSGTLASTRNVIDADAYELWDEVMRASHDWCVEWHAAHTCDPVHDIRSWYAATRSSVTEPSSFFPDTLTAWRRRIDAIMEPHAHIEITGACPECGAEEWWGVDGTRYRHPVVVSYPRGSGDVLGTARAVCRACEHVWRSSLELRSLAWSLEHNAQPEAA